MTASGETRQRILESARDLIYSRSYADVGVAEICERADVRKGSFYHFFPSKQELTLAVMDAFFAEFKERILSRAFQPDIPPLARIVRLLQLGYEFQKELADAMGHTLGCPFGNLASERSTQDEAIRVKADAIFARMEQQLTATLHEAAGRGEIGPEVDVESTALAMFAMIEGLMLRAKTRNDPELIRQLGPTVADIRVLRAPPA
ncbi:MAG: TetR/AcrR family transcriptional regulator [Chromatiales bacterium]|nr:TetR/AcrR family transcriptional regulator [Chromatiales bacterium]